MKKHILSKHVESVKSVSMQDQVNGCRLKNMGPTLITFLMETSDPDEFVVLPELSSRISDHDIFLFF